MHNFIYPWISVEQVQSYCLPANFLTYISMDNNNNNIIIIFIISSI